MGGQGQAVDGDDEEPRAGAGMAAQNRGTVNHMRSVCKNGLETAVMMYLDGDNKHRINMLEVCGAPLQAFFSECS